MGKPHPLSSVRSYFKLFTLYKHVVVYVSIPFEPKSFHQAIHFFHYREVMTVEIKALEDNQAWSLTFLPVHKKLIGCKWSYKIKYRSNGSIERYKARLVAKEYRQVKEIDFEETLFSGKISLCQNTHSSGCCS